jgi:hypothetical protein
MDAADAPDVVLGGPQEMDASDGGELGPAAAQRASRAGRTTGREPRGEARLVVITGSATASSTKVWTEYETALSQVLLESRAGRAPTRAIRLLTSEQLVRPFHGRA